MHGEEALGGNNSRRVVTTRRLPDRWSLFHSFDDPVRPFVCLLDSLTFSASLVIIRIASFFRLDSARPQFRFPDKKTDKINDIE